MPNFAKYLRHMGPSSGGGSGSASFLEEAFWMAPEAGDLLALSFGDNTNASTSGEPQTLVSGPTYHAGDVDALNFPSHANGSRLLLPDVGGPFQDVSKPFWVAGMFRVTGAPSVFGLCGNGAYGGPGKGFNVLVNGDNFSVLVSDGAAFDSDTFPNRRAFALNEWVTFVIEAKYDTGASEVEVRVTHEGFKNHQAGQAQRTLTGIDMSVGGVPVNPGLTIGDRQPTKALPFAGDIVMAGGELVGNEFMSDEVLWMLHNHYRFRLYDDAKNNRNWVKLPYVGPKDNGLVFAVRCDRSVNVKVYDEATRTLQGSSGLTASSDGFVKTVVNGLTASQQVEVQFEDDTGAVATMEWHGTTTPAAGADMVVGTTSCAQWYGEGETIAQDITMPFWMDVNDNRPDFFMLPGDWGYFDINSNFVSGGDVAMMVAVFDDIFLGATSFKFHCENKVVLTQDDHVFEDNGDSTSTDIGIGHAMTRLMNPVETSNYRHATDGWDFSLTIGNYRVMMLDTRTQKIDTTPQMMSPAMRQWFKDEIDAAYTNSQMPIISFSNMQKISPDGPVEPEMWEHFPVEQAELWDHMSSKFGTANKSFFTLSSDVHMIGLASESQSKFDTAGLLKAPAIHVAGLNHPIQFAKGDWDHYEGTALDCWGVVEMTDNGSTVDADFKLFKNNMTQEGTTMSETLKKPNTLPAGLIQQFLDQQAAVGSVVTDESGNANHGSLVQSNCVDLDGVAAYATVGRQILITTNDFSMSFWVRQNGSDSNKAYMSFRLGTTNQYVEVKDAGTDHLQVLLQDASGLAVGGGTVAYQDDAWHHIAVTFDRDGDCVVYLDGVSTTTTSISARQLTLDSGTNNFTCCGGLTQAPDCEMLGMSYYNDLLTQDEVTYLATLGVSGTNPTTANLEGRWKAAEGVGDILYDSSGNGSDATQVSGVGRSTQDEVHFNIHEGFSLYEHATLDPLYVPYGDDGSPLTITPPVGYTKTHDSPSGIFHNGCETGIDPNDTSAVVFAYDARTNPRFRRIRTTSAVNAKMDRLMKWTSALSGQDLTDANDYTATIEG